MLNADKIYTEYAEMVFKFLMSLCGDEDVAEELTQETFYQAIKSLGRYDGTCKVSTWLCQIAKHLWYKEISKRKRYGTCELNENIVSDKISPEDRVCVADEKMQLMKQIHKLNEIEKEIVLLRISAAFSFKEIGEVFERNENWARVTFYRAKQKITAMYEGEKKGE